MTKRAILIVVLVCTFAVLNVSAQDNANDEGVPFLPDDLQPITSETVADLQLLGELGYGEALDLQWSPSGDFVWVLTHVHLYAFDTAAMDGPALTIDVADAQVGFRRMAFSQDGKQLAVLSRRNQLSLYDVDGPQLTLRTEMTFDRLTTDLTYTSDDHLIVLHSDTAGPHLYNIQTEALIPLAVNREAEGVLYYNFSADGSHITAHRDGVVNVLDTASGTGSELVVQPVGFAHYLAHHPDQGTLATNTRNGTVEIRDVATDTVLRTYDARIINGPTLTWSPDGMTLALGSTRPVTGALHEIRLWRLDTGNIQILSGHNADASFLRFSRDGERIATIARNGVLRIWNANSGEAEAVVYGFNSSASDVRFSHDESHLITAGGLLSLWELSGGVSRGTIDHSSLTSHLLLLPNGDLIGAGGYGEGAPVRIWSYDGEYGYERPQDFLDHEGQIRDIDITPDNNVLLVSSQNVTRLYELTTGTSQDIAANTMFRNAAVTADASRVALASTEGEISLIDVATGEIVAQISDPDGVATSYMKFTPGADTLLTIRINSGIRLLDGDTLEAIWEYPRRVSDAVYSPNQELIIASGIDGIIVLSADDGTPRVIIEDTPAISMAPLQMNKTGTLLVTGGGDGRLYIWGVPGSQD